MFKKNGIRGLLSRSVLVPAALFLAFFLLCSVDARAEGRPAGQVIFEGGMAVPYGNLGDDFEASRLGLGAREGLELGFRYRFHLSPSVSLSPAFHLVDFGNLDGYHPELEEFTIEALSLRYSVELMVSSPYRKTGVPRPFLAVGAGLYRNRVQGYINDFYDPNDESINTLGVSFRGGVQVLGFELSLVYHLNRFNTWNFHRTAYRERYNWDSLGVRIGWKLPLIPD